MGMTYFADHALLPDGLARSVRFGIADGRFTSVTPNSSAAEAHRLPGLVLPGFANAHSHAFHRALRGRTHGSGGDFWSWREGMYAVAGRLDPDSYLALARAAYAEMVLAGVTGVAEFHYLHHAPGGARYGDPNAMAEALRAAAADAGLRLTLLDACYLAGGLAEEGHTPLSEPQLRFADPDVDGWAARASALKPTEGMTVGVAIHSVRAVPAPALSVIAHAAASRPLHVHLSEQLAENDACRAVYGCTPTALLQEAGVLGAGTTAVHATHLTRADIAALGGSETGVCMCPSTEEDLADGIGPSRALADAGAMLSLGSDQHALIDLLAEARALEMHERLISGQRGRFAPAELAAVLTNHASLGHPDAGRLEAGARADLVALRLDTPRTAGTAPEEAWRSASAADVDTVLVGGKPVVEGGCHRLGDVGALLADAIAPLWEDTP